MSRAPLQIDSKLHKRLKIEAAKEGCTLSKLIERIYQDWEKGTKKYGFQFKI